MAKVNDLKEAILDAVVELDSADGSRTSMFTCSDAARDILADVYGEDFESDLAERLQEADSDEDSDDFDNSGDE